MKVSLEAGEFHYVGYGDEGAPPMVLVHGMGWSSSTWEQVAPTLAKTRRVIALDLRGHGESVWTPTYSFEEMRDDLLEFADRLELGKFLLCGHSMGASVSWLFAERYVDRLTGLVIVDAAPPDGDGDWTVPPKPEGELIADWEMLIALYGQQAKPDPAWWADLPKITVPTLIVGGGSTSKVPQESLAAAAKLLPDATLVTVEGAGHHVQTAKPDELLAAIEQWAKD
ncbi:pimeloyl-ACP methyl ester carboxylesterase [Kribbella orskensis]|uniref:Pimeloyl-ACP methyl ester carboxylesterase n=1 Tax=Kribbella orskensis TaxID=2512216 RepID=A0ABY2BSF6_9ACTN|nr:MULTISPECIES: alpha/beta hydrolase [Kribbella]TCN43105.1 pimeloyl-ACP methyl ester carboxylesterase [Kribbella sp. VKM Ac-2500]TCO29539.1 pimeloyl-ACP methyl ester carboxylesterase [Kribbella orskensis]